MLEKTGTMADGRHARVAGWIFPALVGLSLATGASAATRGSSGKKLVCWTEESGRRACGDAVPSQYSSSERTVHDSTGRVIRTIPGELSDEQRAARAETERKAEEERREAQQQAAYDRALLASYSKPEELAALRDDRLLTIDTSVRLAEKAGTQIEDALAKLRKRLPRDEKTPSPPRVPAQIAELEKSLRENRDTLADLRRRRDSVCSSFDHDIHRFQELKFGTIRFHSSCPAPGTLLPGEPASDIAGAKTMFESFVALAKARDPALLSLYAAGARIEHPYDSASGSVETAELTLDEYRSEVLDYWRKAKPDTLIEFADLGFTSDGQGGAKVSGTRLGPADKRGKFHLIVRPDASGSWKIVGQWSETRL